MSPTIFKLNLSRTTSNVNYSPDHCPYCHCERYWKHGSYIRKGFHSKKHRNTAIFRTVNRYICTNRTCKHTFSILPSDVLPYCRFLWDDFTEIANLLAQKTSAWSVAKYHWGISLKIILRLNLLITRVYSWLQTLHQEAYRMRVNGIETLVSSLLEKHSWMSLRAMWYRYIYPLRF